MSEKHRENAGRPPFFEDPEELNKLVEQYFENPPRKKRVIGGEVVEIPNITITGLVLHLGFASRQSFYAYEKKPEFNYTLKRARTFIENDYESCLRDNNVTGVIFALKNLGWSDKSEIDHTSQGEQIQPVSVSFEVKEPKGPVKVTNAKDQ